MADFRVISEWVSRTFFTIWLALFIWSFISIQMTEPTGSGFTRGFNRFEGFFLYQAIAMGLALLAWIWGIFNKVDKDWIVRGTRYAPIVVSGLFWLAIVSFYGFLVAGTEVK